MITLSLNFPLILAAIQIISQYNLHLYAIKWTHGKIFFIIQSLSRSLPLCIRVTLSSGSSAFSVSGSIEQFSRFYYLFLERYCRQGR